MTLSPHDRLSYFFDYKILEISKDSEQLLVDSQLTIPKIQFRVGKLCLGGIKATDRTGSLKFEKFENSFVGCMSQMQLQSNPIDTLQQSIKIELSDIYKNNQNEMSNILPKCIDKNNDQCKIDKSETPIDVSFKLLPSRDSAETIGVGFVTNSKDCVLFYRLLTREKNSEHLLLQLKNGRFKLSYQGEGSPIVLEPSGDAYYADNKLHIVYVVKERNQLKIIIDNKLLDTFEFKQIEQSDTENPASTVSLYMAGVPLKLRTFGEENLNNFEGCLTQIVYNDNQLELDKAVVDDSAKFSITQCYKVASSVATKPDVNKMQMILNKYAKVVQKIHYADRQLNIQNQNTKIDECGLSKHYDTSVLKPVGLRFGQSKQSRLEVHDSFPIKISTFISFKFRTLQSEGLMFYASDAQFSDFLAIWLQDGRVNYAFDCGSGFMHIKSERAYNDGRYHTVSIKRDKQKGVLIIADRTNTSIIESVEDTSIGGSNSLSVVEPYYFGSIPESDRLQLPAAQSDLISTEPFNGCMTDFNIAHKSLKNRSQEIDLMNCSNNHESGIFFRGLSLTSYSALENFLTIKNAYEISFEMKSRTKNGVLLYIGPKENDVKDYILLELVDGELIYKVKIGGAESLIKYSPEIARNELCNSNWLKIKITKEEKSFISLEVKGIEKKMKLKQDSKQASNLFNVYMGALPSRAMYAEITQTNEPFVGCIRDFVIRKDNNYATRALLEMNLEPGILKYCPLK